MATPLRSCVACRKKETPLGLLRLALVRRGEELIVCPDPNRRISSRGAWVCPKDDCIHKLSNKGVLARAFRQNVKMEPGLMTFFKGFIQREDS
ncbi:MAG: YlxR family protein [Deltaproteobacteria bacterium]|nr:YlxR family protein [Deltaproteobacteria bacterium]